MFVPQGMHKSAPAHYLRRRREIADQATGVHAEPVVIEYEESDDETWRKAMELLDPIWERHVAVPLHAARYALQLPTDHIPQLALISRRLRELTGFRYASVPGTVSGREFFAAIARGVFPSTQFIRWSGDPHYTPAPDVLHEVGGHAVLLANKHLAELHRLAGRAAVAAQDPQLLKSVAAVFWYTAEFGVIASRTGWKAYGAGLLSSPGELSWFAGHADVRPINIAEMITTPFDIEHFQPVLFGADSLEHVLDVAGRFFTDVADRIDHSDDHEPVVDLRFTSR